MNWFNHAERAVEEFKAFEERAIRRAIELDTDLVIVQEASDPFTLRWVAHFDGASMPGARFYPIRANREESLKLIAATNEADAIASA